MESTSEPKKYSPDDILTAKEVALLFRVSLASISRLVKSEGLVCYRLGRRKGLRFRYSEVQSFFDNRIEKSFG